MFNTFLYFLQYLRKHKVTMMLNTLQLIEMSLPINLVFFFFKYKDRILLVNWIIKYNQVRQSITISLCNLFNENHTIDTFYSPKNSNAAQNTSSFLNSRVQKLYLKVQRDLKTKNPSVPIYLKFNVILCSSLILPGVSFCADRY